MLKESVDLDILGVRFDSKMTFDKHLHSVCRAASQMFGILRKSWLFHDRLLLGRCFWVFVLTVLEYCSAVWCLATDTTGPCCQWSPFFFTSVMLDCDLAHRRSVAVLCMLYKIRCYPIHPLCGAPPVPYVPVRVTCGALVEYRYTYAPPRCRASQYCRTFILLSVSLEWS